jgi:hypothetical protein
MKPTSDPTHDWFTRARHIIYGTASTLVEMVQDPKKRDEGLSRLSRDLSTLADELAEKGEQTEREALQYLETTQSSSSTSSTPVAPAPSSTGVSSQTEATNKERVPDFKNASDLASPKPTSRVSTSQPENKVTSEDIADLMALTRQIESLRLDLEQKRLDPKNLGH